jgi:hypothetical protein
MLSGGFVTVHNKRPRDKTVSTIASSPTYPVVVFLWTFSSSGSSFFKAGGQLPMVIVAEKHHPSKPGRDGFNFI